MFGLRAPSSPLYTVMMHVLPIAFQLSLPHPFLSNKPLPSVLAPLHSVLSSFSPHLPVFCALSTLPPALSVLVQPRPLFPLCLPFPLWCCPLTPHSVLPLSLLLMPPPNPARDPKSSCSSLDCSPFKFFLGVEGGANNCCQQAPHKIPVWLLLWGLQWHTGCNGH